MVSEETQRINVVSFTLPSLPGSVNQIYEPGYSIYSRKPEWKISATWQQWQGKMMPYIKRLVIAENSLVQCDCLFFYDFYYKNKRLRKVDTHNLMKLLLDTIEKKCDWNDEIVKRGSWDSRHAENAKVEVKLTEIPENEWR